MSASIREVWESSAAQGMGVLLIEKRKEKKKKVVGVWCIM